MDSFPNTAFTLDLRKKKKGFLVKPYVFDLNMWSPFTRGYMAYKKRDKQGKFCAVRKLINIQKIDEKPDWVIKSLPEIKFVPRLLISIEVGTEELSNTTGKFIQRLKIKSIYRQIYPESNINV